MGISDIVRAILPAVSTALGGPLAGAAVSFLADKLGASEHTKEAIANTLNGMKPEDLIKIKELDYEFQKFMAENDLKVDLAQISVNEEEAKSTNWFVSGGRPFIMWVCGVSFAYVGIVEPFARFIAQVGFGYVGPFPVIDTSLTQQVLIGLLGLGYLRSKDKKNGVAS